LGRKVAGPNIGAFQLKKWRISPHKIGNRKGIVENERRILVRARDFSSNAKVRN